jgi:hypothetical protein
MLLCFAVLGLQTMVCCLTIDVDVHIAQVCQTQLNDLVCGLTDDGFVDCKQGCLYLSVGIAAWGPGCPARCCCALTVAGPVVPGVEAQGWCARQAVIQSHGRVRQGHDARNC